MPLDLSDVLSSLSDTVRTELAALGDQRTPVPREAAPEPAEHLPCVLVVDDEADMRSFVSSCLESRWQVEEAANGEAGLDCLTNTAPVLAIVDVRMPGMDGVTFARTLKADADTQHIPVLLISGQPPPEHAADAFLAKPFTRRRLVDLVDRLLEPGAAS